MPVNEAEMLMGWIFGYNPVLEALRAGRRVRTVHVYAGRREGVEALIKEAGLKGVPVRTVEDRGFFDSRFGKGHQGVAAEVGEQGPVSIEDLLAIPSARKEPPFFVVLDGVEDPRNFGAILRSAECGGVHGVVIQKRRAAGLTPAAEKASAGASGYVPVVTMPNIKHALDIMKDKGITLAGAEAGAGKTPWEADLSGPVCLVIGGEDKGLRRTVAERCDVLVGLPVLGRVNSLNASVAAGILIYELIRQRTQKKANK